MTPRVLGWPLAPEHWVVRNAIGIYDAARGYSTVPNVKRSTAKLTKAGTVVYRSGRGGREWSGNGSNAYLYTTFTPKHSADNAVFGCVFSRYGTKTAASGREVLVCMGDASSALGVEFIIGIDDQTYTDTAGKIYARGRYQNGGTAYVIAGPVASTNGTPMAVAVGLRDNADGAIVADLYVDGRWVGTNESATTSTVAQHGTFAVGATYVYSTASGSYMTSASAVQLAWHGTTAFQKSTHRALLEWTENPWGIYAKPTRRYYWPSIPTSGYEASLTGSLDLGASIAAALSAKKASLSLKNAAGIAQANLTGLKWAWWDAITPDLIAAAPTDKGAALTTDENGLCEIPLVNSVKASGQVGWVVITDSDGTTTQSPVHSAYTGPAEVD